MPRGALGAGAVGCRFCSTSMRNEGSLHGQAVWRCAACRYVECHPRPTPQQLGDLYADPTYHRFDYDADRARADAVEWAPLARRLARLLVQRGARVAEVGPGTGGLLLALRDEGLSVRGYEVSEAASRFLRDMFGLEVETVDAEHLVLPRDLQAVLAFHVLEHLREPDRFLTQVRDALPLGGVLVLEVPDYDARMRRQLGARWPYWLPGEHLQHFSADFFRRALPSLGFEIVRVERRGGLGLLQPSHGIEGVAVRSGAVAPAGRLTSWLYASRGRVYAVPAARGAVRWLNRRVGYDLLHRNAYLQVWARRTG